MNELDADLKFIFEDFTNRHFRPKLVHCSESIYCTPIDRALKMRFSKESGSFQRASIHEL